MAEGHQCMKCPVLNCPVVFSYSSECTPHFKTAHSADIDNETVLRCINCTKQFASRKAFIAHLKRVEVKRPRTEYDFVPTDLPYDDQVSSTSAEPVVQPKLHQTVAERERAIDEHYSQQVSELVNVGVVSMLTDRTVSMAAILDAIALCADLNKASVDYAEHLVRRIMKNVLPTDPGTRLKLQSEITLSFEKIRKPLHFVRSRYLFDRYFSSMDTFTAPIYVPFMVSESLTDRFVGKARTDPKKNDHTAPANVKHCGYMRVPMAESLSKYFSANPELIDELQRPSKAPPHVYARCVDGSASRENPLLSDPNLKTVGLVLTFDDVLASAKGQKKECIYQFSIINLPPYYSSSADGMFLLCQGSSADFNGSFYRVFIDEAYYRAKGTTGEKISGTNMWLEQLSKEIMKLETCGFNVYDNRKPPGEQRIQMFATLVAVVADNLAIHQVFSYAASFSLCKFPCVICSIHHSELGQKYTDFRRRSEDEYELWSHMVQQAYATNQSQGDATVTRCGLKGVCRLKTMYWTVPSNVTIDIMHDVDYGTLQSGLICLLRKCDIDPTLPNFTIRTLNSRLASMKWGIIDSRNTFHSVNKKLSEKNKKALKFNGDGSLVNDDCSAATGLKAAQGYAFVKLLDQILTPFLIPRNHMVWNYWTQFRGLIMASHSFRFTKPELNNWGRQVQTTVHGINTICGKYPLKRPKDHYFCHMKDAVERNGPVIAVSAYAPERALGLFTRQNDASRNSSTHISKTGATIRQYKQAGALQTGASLKDTYRTKSRLNPAQSCPFFNKLSELQKDQVKDLYYVRRFTFRGTGYSQGFFVLVKEDDNNSHAPKIVRIEGVFTRSSREKDAFVLVSDMLVVEDVPFRIYGGYVIDKMSDNLELMCLRTALYHRPMDGYGHFCEIDGEKIDESKFRVYTNCHSQWMRNVGPYDQPF